MKLIDAQEYVKEVLAMKEIDKLSELSNLVIWAYDKGYSEGSEDYIADKINN